MLLDLGIYRLPFVRIFQASGLLAHSNKARDVIRPSRVGGMRNFLISPLGLLERADVLDTIGLARIVACGPQP
jgi:hypothetical protein